MLGVEGKAQNVRAVLALESKLPEELLTVKNMLGVEVVTDVEPS